MYCSYSQLTVRHRCSTAKKQDKKGGLGFSHLILRGAKLAEVGGSAVKDCQYLHPRLMEEEESSPPCPRGPGTCS